MTDTMPLDQLLAAPPRRDRRIGIMAALSAVLHLLVIGALLLLPMLHRLQQPEAPPPIDVELVPPSQAPPSTEQPSSEAPPSSEQPSMEPASSGVSEPPAASSVPASGSSEAAAAPSAPAEAPVPMQRPVLIPVAPDEPSSEESSTEAEASTLDPSAASEASAPSAPPDEPAMLATSAPGAEEIALPSSAEEPAASSAEASSEQPPPPRIDGALHVARTFYLAGMLEGPAMANAREAIRKLPPQKRLVQTCNIEAIAQIGQASRQRPDAIVADAFAPTQPSGTSFKVTAGAFRSDKKWYAVSYDCTLSKDLSRVQSFSFRIGSEVALPSRAPAQVKQGG